LNEVSGAVLDKAGRTEVKSGPSDATLDQWHTSFVRLDEVNGRQTLEAVAFGLLQSHLLDDRLLASQCLQHGHKTIFNSGHRHDKCFEVSNRKPSKKFPGSVI
jgi:predicted nucleic acid-binding protein